MLENGGINPDNCVEVVKRIDELLPKEIHYWINMDKGVRDEDDLLYLDKCE